MVVAAAMMPVMVMAVSILQISQFLSQGSLTFHSLQQLRAGELVPGSGDHGSMPVVFPDQSYGSVQLCLGNRIRAG